MSNLKACIPDLVIAAEKAAADGTITPGERKEFVMGAINIIASKFGYKLSGILKWAVGKLVDVIAQRLPSKDIKVSDVIQKMLKEWANA